MLKWSMIKGDSFEKMFVFPEGYVLPDCNINIEFKKSSSAPTAEFSLNDQNGVSIIRDEDPQKIKLFSADPFFDSSGQYIWRMKFNFDGGRERTLITGTLAIED